MIAFGGPGVVTDERGLTGTAEVLIERGVGADVALRVAGLLAWTPTEVGTFAACGVSCPDITAMVPAAIAPSSNAANAIAMAKDLVSTGRSCHDSV